MGRSGKPHARGTDVPAAVADAAGHADWGSCARSREDFVDLVRERGRELYRDLPWRGIDDPYAVLVSEVMLQQTQVKRVLRFWPRWMSLFPTVEALAAADTADVLEVWQGLGYNRRALALWRACAICSSDFAGELPQTADELVKLPGIGPATAAGVVAFAYNRPAIYLETNVRSVFLHELFPLSENVSDRQLMPFVSDTCPINDPRSWYYSLLDYGAHLKSVAVNPSRRSRHHVRQSAFEGSRREKRSFLLKEVLASPDGLDAGEAFADMDAFERAAGRPPLDADLFDQILAELVSEGFFRQESNLLIP